MFEESASLPSIWASMNSWFTPTVLFVLLNLMIGTILFTSNLANHRQEEDEKAQNDPQPPKIARSPSVLQRLRSINLYPHRSQVTTMPLLKQIPDSDTHFPVEETHHQQTLETAAQYVFNQTHEQQPLNTEAHFVIEQTHQQQTASLYLFNQTHEEKSLDSNTQFLVEPTHEEEDEQQSLDEVYSQLTDGHVNRTKSDTKPASGEFPERLPAKMRKSASLKSAFSHFEEVEIVEARRPATVRERTEEDDVEVDAKADDFINKFKQQLKLQRIDSIMRYKDMANRGSGN